MQPKVTKPAQFHGTDPAMAAESNPDARFAKRKDTLIPASIGNPALPKWISCKVVDTSSSGAQLQVARSSMGDMRLLDRYTNDLTLNIPGDRSSVECRLIWRDNDRLGVEYTRPVRKIAKPIKLKPRVAEPKGFMESILNKAGVKPV